MDSDIDIDIYIHIYIYITGCIHIYVEYCQARGLRNSVLGFTASRV